MSRSLVVRMLPKFVGTDWINAAETLRRTPLLALVLLLTGAVGACQCKAGDALIGEDNDRYYCLAKSQYQDSPTMHLASRYCSQRNIVAADKNAIGQLGFSLDAQRMEAYNKVAVDQKAEMEHKVIFAFLDQGLEAAEMGLKSAKSLNPWNVSQAVKTLESNGFANEALIAALRRVAAQRDKPAMFEAYKIFIDLAKASVEGWQTGKAVDKEPENAQLLLLLAALKTVQKNPELGLIVTGADFTESMAYLYYLNGNINDLASATDEKLARLPSLSQRLHEHVHEMVATRQTWRQQTGYMTATPVCEAK